MLRRPREGRSRAVLLALAAIILLATACGGGDPPRPPPTPTPLPSPPPTDVPLDLQTAGRLRHDGQIEQAIAVYQEIAANGGDEEKRSALLALAQTQYGQGDFAEAAAAANELLDSDPADEQRRLALLILGSSYVSLGSNDAASDAFTAYIEDEGPASAYARVNMAALLSENNDPNAAIEQLGLALADDLPPAQETAAMFSLGHAQEATGLDADAMETWDTLSRDADSPSGRGEALWLLASKAARTGDTERATDALTRLAREYPSSDRAIEALNGAVEGAVPQITELERGIVLYRHNLGEQAGETLQTIVTASIDPQETAGAHLYLGFLAERASTPDDALTHYDAVLTSLAGLESSPDFGEAAWNRALLLETLGRTDEAIAGYAALGAASPGSSHAGDALFRAGLLSFILGRPGDALAHWTALLEITTPGVTPPGDRARANFWLYKASLTLGDAASAETYLEEAAAGSWDYYGLRARAILEDQPPMRLTESGQEIPTGGWPGVERWLASLEGAEDAQERESLTAGSAWVRGFELLAAGLHDQGRQQVQALINDAADRAWSLYRLARALSDIGEAELAARAAVRLISDTVDAPVELMRLAYPSDYSALAGPESETNGFSQYLLFALIRQESFFQPDARSSADALGLTQVIPSTADEIAGQLGVEDFRHADLLRPNVSVRFGAHYLGSQLELFEGDISAALAAYNGGPGNALRWREAAPNDPELFLETIDLSETRAYVELVLEHYAHYRYAYGLAEQPGLPLP